MAERYGEIAEGDIHEKTYEEREIEWKITNISSVIKCEKSTYISPDFSFANKSVYFALHPKYSKDPEFLTLFILYFTSYEYPFQCECGVKLLDNSVELLRRETGTRNGPTFFCMRRSEIERRKSELAPSNVLTIVCTLKRLNFLSTQPSAIDRKNVNKLARLDTLSKNYKDLFSDKGTCDTTLCVKDKEYTAHKTVLMARSSVFSAMFKHDTKEKQTNIVTIPDCDPESFNEFLEYMYSGELEVSSSRCALHLYETSDKYDVQELKEFCVNHLKENLSVENVCDVVTLADKYDDSELFSASQNFVNENLHEMFQASEWESLMRNNLRLASKLLKGVPKSKFVK